MKIRLTQQISSEASSHAVSDGFSFNFVFFLVDYCFFWELAERRSGKSRLTVSNSVEVRGPVMSVAVESPIPGEHVGGTESKAKGEDDFDHNV